MSTNNESNEEIKMRWYVVAFLDILNQRQELEKLQRAFEENTDRESITVALRKSLGKVLATRKCAEDMFRDQAKRGPAVLEQLTAMTPEMQETFMRATLSDVKSMQFSDTIILYDSLSLDQGELKVGMISKMVGLVGALFALGLMTGVVMRGSIECGPGIELGPGDLYGPVIASAASAESNIAKWPRVVAGDGLLRLIDTVRSVRVDRADMRGRVTQGQVNDLLNEFVQDPNDERYFVHWLGPRIRSVLDQTDRKIVEKATALAESEMKAAEQRGDRKVRNRYRKLLDYIHLYS